MSRGVAGPCRASGWATIHVHERADGEARSCAAATDGSAIRFFWPQRGRLHGLRSCPATAFARWPARRACVRFRPRESQIRMRWTSPGTPAVGPRFARNSGPFRRHACSSHATAGTHSCPIAGLKGRPCARCRVCGRGSDCLSDHRICRRRRCQPFRLPPVLERLHPRKISDLHLPWRAFLLLSCGCRSRQGDHPGLARIRGHARARCEIVDMTHPRAVPPALSIGEIHVWTARLVDEHHAAADLLRILSRKERARAAQFAFERDRMRFIQAHGVMRRILSSYCAADAATLTFARNHHGKPHLIARANSPNLQFSVSHSSNCCMLAVRLDHSIGIDVEKVRDLPRPMDIVRSYFTPAESQALAALRGTARRDAFFALWTHKEAAVKGLGIGLAAHLGRIEFDLDLAGGLRFAAWDGDQSVAQNWSIVRLDPQPGYVAAVASAHPIRRLTLHNWRHTGAD